MCQTEKFCDTRKSQQINFPHECLPAVNCTWPIKKGKDCRQYIHLGQENRLIHIVNGTRSRFNPSEILLIELLIISLNEMARSPYVKYGQSNESTVEGKPPPAILLLTGAISQKRSGHIVGDTFLTLVQPARWLWLFLFRIQPLSRWLFDVPISTNNYYLTSGPIVQVYTFFYVL